MRTIIFAFTLAVMLPLAMPAAAAPEEVMPEVKRTHIDILRTIFIKTTEFIERVNYDEEKAAEEERWRQEYGGCCGIGIRG